MSNVQKFVNGGGRQYAASKAEPGKIQGMDGWMDHLGINPALIAPKIGSKGEAERRPSSRQAVAERSRVSTAFFKPQSTGNSHHVPQQSRFESTLPSRSTSIDGRSTQGHHHPESKKLGVFDTDTEKLDDTTSFDNSMDFTIKSEAFPEDTTRSRNNVVVPRVRHVGPNLQNKILSHAPASLISVDFASHDGDDELDDSSRYEDFASSGRKNPANFRNQGDAFQFNGMGQGSGGAMHQDLCSGFQEQPSLPPKIPQDSVKTDFDGGSQHHPHHISSTAPPSDDDSSPGVENEGSIGSPAPDKGSLARHVKAEAPDDFQTDKTRFPHGDSYDDIPIKKRKHSPGLESQKQLHDIQLSDAPSHHPTKHNGYSSSHNLTREHNTPYANAQKDLDYEPQVLANMSYQQLADEPFDTSPHHIDLNDPALTSDSSLSDRLRYLHSLGGPKESVQLQRQAFFSSLPIAHYEECGDLMADQFSQIITKFKEARQQKRRLAREFEDEVSAREKVVESRKAAVMNDLSRLKRAGQDVVRR